MDGFKEYLLKAKSWLTCFLHDISFNLHNSLGGACNYYHFINEKTEAQRFVEGQTEPNKDLLGHTPWGE